MILQKFFTGRKKPTGPHVYDRDKKVILDNVVYPVIWEGTNYNRTAYYHMDEKGDIFLETDDLTIEELDKKFAAFRKKVDNH